MATKTLASIPLRDSIVFDLSPNSQFLYTCEKYSQAPDNFKIWDLEALTLESQHEWQTSIKDSVNYVRWSSDCEYMVRTKTPHSKEIDVFNTLVSTQDQVDKISLDKISNFGFIPRNAENAKKPLYFVVATCGSKETKI